MLEDRSQQAKRPVDDAMVEELLSEYGAPKKVAESYGQTKYLIGPRLYPFFILVLKIVLAVVTLGLTIVTIVSLVRSNMNSPEVMVAIGRYVLSLLSGLIQAFGNVVLIFAILEGVLPASEFETKETE